MNRSVLRILCLIIMLPLIFTGCWRKKAVVLEPKPKDRIILRLAETLNANYPSVMGCLEFAKLVETRTDGRIKVRIFQNGELGDENSIIEQVQFGGIDLARVNSLLLGEYFKKMNLLVLPYIYRDEAHLWQVLEGNIGEKFADELIAEKIVSLCWYNGGEACFYNIKQEINSVKDFKGLKLGVPRTQLLMDLISNLGGSPAPTDPDEIDSALQSGALDGARSNLIAFYLSKHYEIAKYLTIDQGSYLPDILIASRVSMMQLTKEDQKIILEAAKDSALIQKKVWVEKQLEVMSKIKNAGVKVTYFNKAEQLELREKAEAVYSLFSQNEQQLIEEIRKAKSDF